MIMAIYTGYISLTSVCGCRNAINGYTTSNNRRRSCFAWRSATMTAHQSMENMRYICSIRSVTAIAFDFCFQNRMLESIDMFETVVNLKSFSNTPIILFLNKLDVFREKLAKLPLQWHFPDYRGGRDVDAACQYILGKFMEAIHVQRSKSLTP